MTEEITIKECVSADSNIKKQNFADLRYENFELIQGQVIHDIIKNKTYRLLYIPKQNSEFDQKIDKNLESLWTEKGYWICIDSKSNIPEKFDMGEIQLGLSVCRYIAVPDNFHPMIPEKISEAAQKKMDKIYALISDLINEVPDIYDRSKRMNLLQEAAKNGGVKLNNLYNYLGKYWRGGMVKEALLPNLSKIGKGRKEDFVPKNRLGRPSKYQGQNGKILTEMDFKNFNEYIKTLYYSTKKPKFREVYDNMLAHCYSRPRFEGDTSPEALPPEEKPSYMQFYYWYRKNRNSVEEAQKRLGENKFNLTSREITGRSEVEIKGPGFVYQIDATIADYYLVQEQNRNSIIGRPIIFFVRDVKTRMITGMYVTLENASYNGALMALKNCAEDKVVFCRRYGIEIKPEEWPCKHLPIMLIGDNGEIANLGIESVILQLGITVQNTPPYRGDLKAIIESIFNSLNIHLHYLVPGHVDKDAGERGAIDRKKEACVDLKTFIRLMIRCVLFYNNKWYMKTYQKTPEMRLHHTMPIPLELWNYGMQYESGALRTLSQDEIHRVLLPKSEATVTEKGIMFSGLSYTCPDAESNLWFAKARISGRYKITIAYDPSCLDVIYLYRENGTLTKCTLLSKSAAYSGASEEDMKRYHEEDLQDLAAYSQEEEQAKTNLILEIEAEVARCQKEKSDAVRNTVAARLGKKHIRENRSAEKDEISGKAEAMREQKQNDENSKDVKTSETSSASSTTDVLHDNIVRCLKQAGLLAEDD